MEFNEEASVNIPLSRELKLFMKSISAAYRFFVTQSDHELYQRALMLDLIHSEKVKDLALRFDRVPEGGNLPLNRDDLFSFFTLLDLVCRSHESSIGDAYKSLMTQVNEIGGKKYDAIRSTELSLAYSLLARIREDFSEDPEFEEISERLQLLEN